MSFLNLSVADSIIVGAAGDHRRRHGAACLQHGHRRRHPLRAGQAAQHIVLVPAARPKWLPCCARTRAAAGRQSADGNLAPPLHTREFGSQITNVLRCLQLEAHGYQVSVTELVGWEHSMKNELIIAQYKDLPRRRPAERLQVLESWAWKNCTSGSSRIPGRVAFHRGGSEIALARHPFEPAGVAELAQRFHIALVDVLGLGKRFGGTRDAVLAQQMQDRIRRAIRIVLDIVGAVPSNWYCGWKLAICNVPSSRRLAAGDRRNTGSRCRRGSRQRVRHDQQRGVDLLRIGFGQQRSSRSSSSSTSSSRVASLTT
jgi:hypothetical protein